MQGQPPSLRSDDGDRAASLTARSPIGTLSVLGPDPVQLDTRHPKAHSSLDRQQQDR
jgi:hypothetical protein